MINGSRKNLPPLETPENGVKTVNGFQWTVGEGLLGYFAEVTYRNPAHERITRTYRKTTPYSDDEIEFLTVIIQSRDNRPL